MEFKFPFNLRPSSFEHRRSFYSDDFDVERARDWFETSEGFLALALDVGSETTRYNPKFKKYLDKLVYIRRFSDLSSLKGKLVEYAPEDLYYSIAEMKDGSLRRNKELVFDIDPERIECRKCRLRRRKKPKGFRTFCRECARKSSERTLELYELMQNHFDDISIIFYGKGFYIHIKDKEALNMDENDRRELAQRVTKEFPINKDITTGDEDLIRLPGSINGLVSRKVIEVDKSDLKGPEEIYREKSLPEFLEGEKSK